MNELERHLNALEISKFGGNDGVQMSQKTFSGGYGPSRYGKLLSVAIICNECQTV